MERLRPRRTFQTTLSQPEVREASVDAKLALERRGFKKCHSFWFALKNMPKGVKNYVRVEVWIKGNPTPDHLGRLKEYFAKYPPPYEYSIHSYDVDTDQITFIGASKKLE
jgi:hypothetical protein